jgi:hypothetical protein
MVTMAAFVGTFIVLIGLALTAFVISLTDESGEPRFRDH